MDLEILIDRGDLLEEKNDDLVLNKDHESLVLLFD